MELTALEAAGRKRTYLRRSLLAWFRRNARDLPWRGTGNPYRVWVAEILLQQTRVQAALPYYHRLIQSFPTVTDLAAADEDRVMKLWEGLGYYSRARNLLRAARLIVAEYGGRFPKRADEWRRLPGVGRYTAAAIASIAFGERVAIVDGNAKRVLSRIFDIEDCIDAAKTQRVLWSIAEQLVPRKAPGDFNQALMELGSRVCVPGEPRCDECPVRRHCDARAVGRQSSLPVRRAKKPLPHYEIVAAAMTKNGRYLLGKRPAASMLGGLWELPGGKTEPDETHAQALRRELREELGIEVAVGRLVASVNHGYSHFRITLYVYRCEHVCGRPQPFYYTEFKWVARKHFSRYAVPAATRKILALL
jgi:A/G-specific adenine glycosylase